MPLKTLTLLLLAYFLHQSCNPSPSPQAHSTPAITLQQVDTISEKDLPKEEDYPIANGFDFPVGKPDAKGYYNAQGFGKNNHLGDDWNATTGGDSDLGDPIYAIGNGKVIHAQDEGGGWGKVIIILHQLPDGTAIESLYAHCDEMKVVENEIVEKGQLIGTIGNVGGIYSAHLHFEIRNQLGMGVGAGYSTSTEGYLDPTLFINNNRKL